jgi:hypothetical protein
LHLRRSDIKLIGDHPCHCGDEETEDENAAVKECIGANEENDWMMEIVDEYILEKDQECTYLRSRLGSTMRA